MANSQVIMVKHQDYIQGKKAQIPTSSKSLISKAPIQINNLEIIIIIILEVEITTTMGKKNL
jgi:hypothetical protein